MANRADKEVRLDLITRVEFSILAALGGGDIHTPLFGLIIPNGILNRSVEPDVLVDLVLLRNTDEISEDLFLAWIFASPFAVLLKAETVQRRPDVAAATRVFVIVPSASYAAALLDDEEVTAVVSFYQVDGGANARDAGTNNQNSGVGMIGIANSDFRPGLVSRHDERIALCFHNTRWTWEQK